MAMSVPKPSGSASWTLFGGQKKARLAPKGLWLMGRLKQAHEQSQVSQVGSAFFSCSHFHSVSQIGLAS